MRLLLLSASAWVLIYAARREEDFEELNVEISNMDWVSHASSEQASVGDQFSPREIQQGLLEVLKLVPRSSSREAILDEGKEKAGLKEFLEEAKAEFEGKPRPLIQQVFKDSQFGTKLRDGASWMSKAPKKQVHRSPSAECSKQLELVTVSRQMLRGFSRKNISTSCSCRPPRPVLQVGCHGLKGFEGGLKAKQLLLTEYVLNIRIMPLAKAE